MPKLLLVDDDQDVLRVNQKYFTKEGYQVIGASNVGSALQVLRDYPVDCVVLDVLMPGMDGFEASKRIRKMTDAPFIFLTGCSSEEDRVKGFLLGANDYVVKPYSLRELSARIKVQIRGYHKEKSLQSELIIPPLKLDLIGHKAYVGDEELLLSNREYELIHLLALHVEEVVTFEQIGNAIWGCYSEGDRKTIMVMASRLRKKIEGTLGFNNILETVWSKGYQLHNRCR